MKSQNKITNNPIDEPLIADLFPLLRQQPGLSIDILEDLSSTDKNFGSRYKRGKAARIELLENLENRLEVADLRNKIISDKTLINQLQEMLTAGSGDLTQLLKTPTTLAQSEVVFQVSFLRVGLSGPEFTLDIKTMKEKLIAETSDPLTIQILRALIINTSDDMSAQDIAKDNNLGRQAIYDRQARLISKLDALLTDSDFQFLMQHLRSKTCVIKSSQLTASVSHPLVAILLLPSGEFPSVRDLIALAFWGIAREETGGRKSFQLKSRNSEQWLECPISSRK